MAAINGIEAVELLTSADPAAAQSAAYRGRKAIVERTADQPLTINGIEGVIFADETGGPGTAYRLDSADPLLAYQARQRGQRPLVVINSSGVVVPDDWFADDSYSYLAAVMDFNNDRYALPEMGSELVTNGTFDTDLTGWELKFNGTITHSSGRIRVTADGGASSPRALQTLAGLTIGKFYQATVTSAAQSAAIAHGFFIGIASSGSAAGAIATTNTASTGLRTETLYFTATQTTHYVVLHHNSIVAAGWTEFDNVSVKEVILTPTGRTYGSELVLDGSFTTGNLVTNGRFDTDITGWTNANGGSWSAGVARLTASGSQGNIYQTITTVVGLTYTLKYDIVAIGGGGTQAVICASSTTSTAQALTSAAGQSAGTNLSASFVAVGTTTYILCRTALSTVGHTADFDNITVTEGWLLKGAAVGTETMTISGGTLNLTGDGTNAAHADQSFTTINGQVYEATYTIGSNAVTLSIGTSQGGSQIGGHAAAIVATHTIKFVATGATTWIRWSRTTATLGTVDNVSIRALTAIGTYPKREATFDECFAYTAASDVARTYTNASGVLKNDLAVNARRMTYANAKRQLRLENAGTNLIRNNSMTGAVVGTPGTLPTNWAVTSAGGLTTAVAGLGTENGVDYIDLRVSGTTSSTFYVFRMDIIVATFATQPTWTHSAFFKLVAGSLTNITTVQWGAGHSAGTGQSLLTFTPDGTLTRQSRTQTISVDNNVDPRFVLNFSSGVAVDITLRVGWPQSEVNAFVTDPIRTTGAAVTRAIETARLSPLLEAVLQRAQGSGVVRLDLTNTDAASRRIVGGDANTLVAAGSATTTVTANNGTNTVTGTLGSGSNADAMGAAFAFDASGRSIVANGGTVGTDANAPATRAVVHLGRGTTVSAGSPYGDGYYDLLGISPERLPATNLQALAVAAS